jgi:aspartyl-tRNA(Asn)/glutamyl-tRNA(Gln) amidotransferase subunit C
MKITDQDVTYVAGLANLELTQQERKRMAKDLNSILDYIDRLNELDTTDVPPMAQTRTVHRTVQESATTGQISSVMRDDKLSPCLAHEAALANAPESDGDFFKVPRVIEK